MLNLRRLQILAALEAEGTMTATAQALFMTTSSVSQQVSLLEKETGVTLTVRSGRRVRLTPAALALVHHANQITAAIEVAESSMKRFRTDFKGTVKVSAFSSFSSAILPSALVALSERYPELDVIVCDLEPIQSIMELRAGRIDIAVIDDLYPVPVSGMVQTVLGEDELVLCLPPSYKDLPLGPMQISRFRRANWILDAHQSAFASFVTSLCRRDGFEPKVVGNFSDIGVTLAMVEAGHGIAVLSTMSVMRNPSKIVYRLLEPRASRRVILMHRTTTQDSPLLITVVAELKERVRRRSSIA